MEAATTQEQTGTEIEQLPEMYRLQQDIDMVACGKEVLRLLRQMDARPHDMGDKAYLSRVRVRYVMFLALKHRNPDVFLIPNDETETFWETHLLRPEMYRKDCTKLFGRVVPHHVEVDPTKREQGRANAKQLWEAAYPPSVPEEIPSSQEETEEQLLAILPEELRTVVRESLEVTEEDVIEDRNWLTYYNMYTQNVKHFDSYLQQSVESYLQFMYFCVTDHGQHGWLEPTYSIDLVWHLHMLHPEEYLQYCTRIANQLLIHVPWPKDRDDEQMQQGLRDTDKVWKERFGGSMHDVVVSAE
ncbi:Glycine dehydrogenase [Balamuthia mandrillaris]